jgi:hypothetical protein
VKEKARGGSGENTIQIEVRKNNLLKPVIDRKDRFDALEKAGLN